MYYDLAMRFEIPQFINIPDKLFGPFTFKQTIYLVGGGGIVFVLHKAFPGMLGFILGLPFATLALALVFYKPNGREFMEFIEAWIIYIFSNKFYLWRRDLKKEKKLKVDRRKKRFPEYGKIPEEKREKISDLARSLDILDFEEK